MAITVEQVGRRYYLRGTPYSARNTLKSARCNWDAQEKSWWTGKKDVAEKLVEKLGNGTGEKEDHDRNPYVEGKLRYGKKNGKLRTYYVVWSGNTRRGGFAYRVISLDGEIMFWVNEGDARDVKMYQESRPLASIRQFIEAKKKEEAQEKQEMKEVKKVEDSGERTWTISGASGYGCNGWDVGQTFRTSKRRQEQEGAPEFVTVLQSAREYVREDGLSFGVGDDSGYLYFATVRAATEEEAAPVRKRLEEAKRKKEALKVLRETFREIQEKGEKPKGDHNPQGDQFEFPDTKRFRAYGGGEWFVIDSEFIWAVKNNGADGDMWSVNNVRTGGAGAIGWRIAFDADVAQRIRSAFSDCGGRGT